LLDVARGRRVQPHLHVHRRRDHHRLVGRQQEGGREIIGHARGHLCEQVGRGRADQHEIGRARQLDVADLDLILELPQRGVDLGFGQRAEAHRGDEMLAAPGEHGFDLMPRFLQQPHQFE
jgi:hypothetical protein